MREDFGVSIAMGTDNAAGWHFVNFSDPKSARNPATRRFVRATVAANYHRKERQHHSVIQEHAADEEIKAKADQNRKKHFLSLVRSKEKEADKRCHASQLPSVCEQVEPRTSAHDDDEFSGHHSPSSACLISLAKCPTSGRNDPFGIRFAGIEYQSDYGVLLQHCRCPRFSDCLIFSAYHVCGTITSVFEITVSNHYQMNQ